MTQRKHHSRKDRARIFTQRGGLCHLCGGKIDASREAWELEHIVEFALTQDDSDENLAPAHKKCHRDKTSERAADLAKTERVRAKFRGEWPASRAKIQSRPFTSTRAALREGVERP